MGNLRYHIIILLIAQGMVRNLNNVLLVRYMVLILHYTVVTETKEVPIMKRNSSKKNLSIYRHYRRPYPNAADPTYFIDKLVDGMLALVTGMGSITFFLFLVTM